MTFTGFPASLVQANAEITDELIENQVASVQRMQHQDLLYGGLRVLDAAAIVSKPPSTTHCNLLQTPRSGRALVARRLACRTCIGSSTSLERKTIHPSRS